MSTTKKDVVRALAEKCNISIKDAEMAVNGLVATIVDGVRANGKVQITDFLTIEAKEMKGRPGRNPQTGEEIQIPDRIQLFAKFGKGFKDAVNGVTKEAAAPAPKKAAAKAAPAKKAAPAAAPAKKIAKKK